MVKATSNLNRQNRRPPILCEKCPLRANDYFRSFSKSEFKFVSQFKTGELLVDEGATVLNEGNDSAHLFTVLSGWAIRYKLLEDGRRQILAFALPGDLLGLQATVIGKMDHSVEALSDLVLCVFQRDRVWELFQAQPSLGFDIAWLAAREERALDEHLLSIGQRTAEERLAYLLLTLFERARRLGLTTRTVLQSPITQHHLADALGLSLVHTNKTLRKLVGKELISWKPGEVRLRNRNGLAEVAGFEFDDTKTRPFL